MRFFLLFCSLSAVVLNSPTTCSGANILAQIQIPSYSHHMTFRPLWKALAKRGHNITLLTTDLMEDTENITQVDLSNAYNIMARYKMFEKISEGESIIDTIVRIIDVMEDVQRDAITHPVVQSLLNDKHTKFDLVISESTAPTGLAFGKKFGVPVIGVMSMDGHYNSHDSVGNPTHPVAYPSYDLPFFTNLSFRERVLSTLFSIAWRAVMYYLNFIKFRSFYQELICEVNAEDLKNLSMLFINANPLFNNVRPLGPKTINIGGGLHFQPPKPLPKDLLDYLDNSKEGVIYFNLGSNVKSMHISNRTKDVILETFSQLPYHVLWKFETEDLPGPGKPSNIKMKTWIPQQDVLRHKNIKLFITQGGLQSMEEAVFNYVPMIGIPFFGDQFGNVNKMVAKGYGLVLDHENLDVETFKSTILEVINQPKYREKAKELAELVLDQPMTGLEKAVWWTEYVLRHPGTPHFRDPIVDLPLYQYYLLDVIGFLVVALLVSIYVVYVFVRLIKKLIVFLYRQIFPSVKEKTN